jgi:CBS domain-containing protein
VEAALDRLIMEAPHNPDFINHLGRRALDRRPPTGFLGDLVVEDKGEHAGKLDVKHGGITLITNLARAHSIAAGSTERRTIRRLRAAAAMGRIDAELRDGLEEAFRLLWQTRLEHQVGCLRSGQEPDDFVDPKTLGPLTRRGLKEAFHIIARAQKALTAELGLVWR